MHGQDAADRAALDHAVKWLFTAIHISFDLMAEDTVRFLEQVVGGPVRRRTARERASTGACA